MMGDEISSSGSYWTQKKGSIGLLFFDEINQRTRWWFQILFNYFSPLPGKMIQFD